MNNDSYEQECFLRQEHMKEIRSTIGKYIREHINDWTDEEIGAALENDRRFWDIAAFAVYGPGWQFGIATSVSKLTATIK